MARREVYMHLIIMPTGEEYNVRSSNPNGFLSKDELTEWMDLQTVILVAEKYNRDVTSLRERRDEIGLIVPGDYGMRRTVNDVLADALYWYAEHDQEAITSHNNYLMTCNSGKYLPGHLMTQLPEGLDEELYDLGREVVSTLSYPKRIGHSSLREACETAGTVTRFAAPDDEQYTSIREILDWVNDILDSDSDGMVFLTDREELLDE